MGVMEIQFKEKFLEKQTLHKTNDAKTLIKLIRNNDLLTGGEMAFYLAKMPQEIRKTIQYIRENSSKLLKPNEFLIAYNRGYEITTDKKKIKA
ncbi:UNVERIFIED_CONTAM: hypothetical protein RF648_18105 [Kocuria sp. CPCC 205274]|uniref:Uncharacterized protein n=1 Tax=Herbiconiux daphne TaxID=2970914 RepID=A0ABT2H9A5_9MICO|nr:hypothetical protein [Herbiconiux daphne]MCS5736555.1 hypothetical protein [Herbiconiux daphne]